MVIKTSTDPQTTFIIPFSGHATISEGKRSVQFSPSRIVFCPFSEPTTYETSDFHCMSFQPDTELLKSALSIYSEKFDKPNDDLVPEHTSIFAGHIGAIRYYDQLLSLLSLANNCSGDVDVLSRIGFDEVVTGVFADFLLAASGSHSDQSNGRPVKRSDRSVDIICEHIAAHVGTPLTMTGMEQLTRMTGRAIAYAFQERFGKSPQQWQRDYLLDLARGDLLDPTSSKSIKSIAYDLGFSSSGLFAAYYRRRFGERPSTTHHPRPTSQISGSRKAGHDNS